MLSSWRVDRSRQKRMALSLIRIVLSVAILSEFVLSFRVAGGGAHYIYLASSFDHGLFSVNNLPEYFQDKVLIGQDTYLPLPPMPGILLMPFAGVAGVAFDELWLGYLLSAFNVLLVLILLKQLSIPLEQRRFLLILFFFGTIYLAVMTVGRSWFLAQIAATLFLLLAITETLSRRRVWLIAIWLGFSFLSRSTTILSLPFFIWLLHSDRGPDDRLHGWLVLGFQMIAGLAVPLSFFLYYNYARFGSPIETGYANAVVGGDTLRSAMNYGLFSLVHVPKNIYALLLAGPQAYPSFTAPVLQFPYIYPSPWGMGIFFTTPAFVYGLLADRRERIVKAAWLAIGFILVPLLTYYGIGWVQFGYRYALDFYPFLFLLTALGISRRFDRKARALVLCCVAINIWGAWWQSIAFFRLPLGMYY